MPMGRVGTRVGCIGPGRARISSYELRSPRDMCAFGAMSSLIRLPDEQHV